MTPSTKIQLTTFWAGRMRQESRPLDAYFDPVFTTRSSRPSAKYRSNTVASGSGRYLYFQRPLAPQLETVAPGVLLAPTAPLKEIARTPDEERSKDVAIQTAYRESEAQTIPYSPDFVLDPEAPRPHVLLLRDMRGEVGEKELEIIEHAKAKHRLMDSLPPATDEASLRLRKHLLQLQEMKEFRLRQREIDEEQSARLDALRQALSDRDAEAEFLVEQRVEAMRQRQIVERDRSLDKIQAQRLKVLRKLSMARGRIRAPSKHKRNLIEEYAGYASQVYAPLTRLGRRTDKDPEKWDVSNVVPKLGMTQGLLDGLKMKKTKMALPVEETQRRNKCRDQLRADLLTMTKIIEADKRRPQKERKEDDTTRAAKGSLVTPPKLLLPPPPDDGAELPKSLEISLVQADNEQNDLDLALVLLQRLIRGRAVQNQMFQGKQRRIDLIRELQAAAAAAEKKKSVVYSSAPVPASAFHVDDVLEEARTVEHAALETIGGETASALLASSAKEHKRLQVQEESAGFAKQVDKKGVEKIVHSNAPAPAMTIRTDRLSAPAPAFHSSNILNEAPAVELATSDAVGRDIFVPAPVAAPSEEISIHEKLVASTLHRSSDIEAQIDEARLAKAWSFASRVVNFAMDEMATRTSSRHEASDDQSQPQLLEREARENFVHNFITSVLLNFTPVGENNSVRS